VIVTTGKVLLRRLTAAQGGKRGLVTVIAGDRIEIAPHATVQASLVALSGLTVGDGAHILGNVFVEYGPVTFGVGCKLTRDSATARSSKDQPPKAGLYHVAMDPYVTTTRLQ
jgi:hypothetical protein